MAQKMVHSFHYDDVNWTNTRTALLIQYGAESSPQQLIIISPQSALMGSVITRAIRNLNLLDKQCVWQAPASARWASRALTVARRVRCEATGRGRGRRVHRAAVTRQHLDAPQDPVKLAMEITAS